jgi:endonuclease/exonuclease/phosphatase family metal-dependent hydrolase
MTQLTVLWWNVDWQSRRTEAQIEAVRTLPARPDVIALCELQQASFAEWHDVLEHDGYTVVDSDQPDNARRLRVLLAVKRALRPASRRRFEAMWPGTVASAQIQPGGRALEVHAVHIPNGTSNGWAKIDHLWSVRHGLEPSPGRPPQILCGDFNTPQLERPGEIITFGQTVDGGWRKRPTSSKPFTSDRPFDPVRWDEGERAVLEGLDAQCGMPDAFRRAHPDAIEPTWVPKGLAEDRGRRLDHVFASAELDLVSCEYFHRWRRDDRPLSDHSAIHAGFRL